MWLATDRDGARTSRQRSEHPRPAVVEVGGRLARMRARKLRVACEQSSVASLGAPQRPVRNLLQEALCAPDVFRREAPVVAAEVAHVRDGVAHDASRVIDVWVVIAPSELTGVAKDRAASV